jgi:hypothetical protein
MGLQALLLLDLKINNIQSRAKAHVRGGPLICYFMTGCMTTNHLIWYRG